MQRNSGSGSGPLPNPGRTASRLLRRMIEIVECRPGWMAEFVENGGLLDATPGDLAVRIDLEPTPFDA